MARRRMIDPNFWQSEDISKLSLLARYLFIGMLSNADDEGKGRANCIYLKSVIFPYDDMRVAEVEKALSEISHNTSVRVYEVDGNRYYLFQHWNKWQRVDKPQKSTIPNPNLELNGDSGMIPESFRSDSCLKEKKGKEEKRKEEKYMPGANTAPSAAEAFITLPLNDKTEYAVEETAVQEFKALYPGVDVSQALRDMRGWLIGNPTKRKTKAGILRFITSWLSREQDGGRAKPQRKAEEAGGGYGGDW